MDATPTPFGLPRSRRIKQGRDFARAKAHGQRLTHGCLILNWLRLPPGRPSRLGVITSRRVGGAVARNRARRLMREAFRQSQHSLTQPVDLILVARPSIGRKNYATVQSDYLGALRRAKLYAAAAPGIAPLHGGAAPSVASPADAPVPPVSPLPPQSR